MIHTTSTQHRALFTTVILYSQFATIQIMYAVEKCFLLDIVQIFLMRF